MKGFGADSRIISNPIYISIISKVKIAIGPLINR